MNIEKRRAEIAARKAEIRKLIEGDSENKLNIRHRGRLRKPRNRMHGRFRRRGLPLRGRENASARRGGMALRRGLARI